MKYAKIYSTQPKQYKFLDEETAVEQYTDYLFAVAYSQFDNDLTKAKTFKQWLATEI